MRQSQPPRTFPDFWVSEIEIKTMVLGLWIFGTVPKSWDCLGMLQSFGTFSGFWFSEIEIESFEKDKKNI